MENTTKICKKCNQEKELTEFHVCKSQKTGLYSHCKACKKEYDKKYRQGDKVQNAQKSKEYKLRKRNYVKNLFENDCRYIMLQSAKGRAKKHNLPLNISLEDIIVPEYCPILGIKLERKPYGKGGSFQPASPSLDKIIPEKGYVKGNIMVISMKANIMKANATINELLKFSENMIDLIKNKGYGSN